MATHLVAGPVAILVYGYVLSLTRCVMGLESWSRLAGLYVLAEASREIFWSMLVYCMIVGAWQAYSYKRRYVAAELRLERSERAASEARDSFRRQASDRI